MSRGFKLLSLRSLLLTVVAMCVTSHVAAQAPVRIMPLGDSITAAPGCWRAYLWNQLQTAGYSNIDFVGGVNQRRRLQPGFRIRLRPRRSQRFLHHRHRRSESVAALADRGRPDIIVMHLGTNDMWGGHIPLQNKITALTKLIGQMRANNPNMKIVMAQIIPMNASGCTTCMPDVMAFNNALVPAGPPSLTTAQSPIVFVGSVDRLRRGGGHVRRAFIRSLPASSRWRTGSSRWWRRRSDTGAPVTSQLLSSRRAPAAAPLLRRPRASTAARPAARNFTSGIVGDTHGLPGQRLDIRGLERRVHAARALAR